MAITKRPGDHEYFLLIEIMVVATDSHHLIDGGCYAQSPQEARQVAQNLGRDVCHNLQQRGQDCRLIGYTVKPILAVVYEDIARDTFN